MPPVGGIGAVGVGRGCGAGVVAGGLGERGEAGGQGGAGIDRRRGAGEGASSTIPSAIDRLAIVKPPKCRFWRNPRP